MLPSRTSIPSSTVVGANRYRTTDSSRRTRCRQEGPESPFGHGRKRFHLPQSPSYLVPTARFFQRHRVRVPAANLRFSTGTVNGAKLRDVAPRLTCAPLSSPSAPPVFLPHWSPPSGDPLKLKSYSRTESVQPDALPSDAQPSGDDRLGNSETVKVKRLTGSNRTPSLLNPRRDDPSSGTRAARSIPFP